MAPVERHDEFMKRLRERAMLYVMDNINYPTEQDIIYTINAMLIGASIKVEIDLEELKNDA